MLAEGYVVLRFIDMDTEKINDPLLIGRGANATATSSALLELFGEIDPSTMWVRTSTLWMRFTTNHRIGGRGFSVQMELRQDDGRGMI